MDKLIVFFKPEVEGDKYRLAIDPSSSFLAKQDIDLDKEHIFVSIEELNKHASDKDKLNTEVQNLNSSLRNYQYDINLIKTRSLKAVKQLEALSNMPEKLLAHGDEHFLRIAFLLKVKGLIKELKEYLGE